MKMLIARARKSRPGRMFRNREDAIVSPLDATPG
jgi:hypothetical protein